MKSFCLLYLFQLIVGGTVLGSTLIEHRTQSKKYGAQKYFIHNSDTTYRIILSAENTYGYEIIMNNKVFVRQLNIPGRSGVLGFKKKTDAGKVARLVLKKLSQGIMPPTIGKNELEKLQIDF